MSSVTSEVRFPLSPAQWLQLRGVGNMETLRQMLKVVEDFLGVDLRAGSGSGRQISADLDGLLTRSFAQASAQRRAVLEVLREQLAEVSPASALRYSLTPSGEADPVTFETQQLLQLVTDQVDEVLQKFLQEQRQLAASERDEQRRVWNREWEHSLHKAEVSFADKLRVMTEEYDSALQEFGARRSSDAKTLAELNGVMANMRASIHSMSHSLSQRQWEVDEAKQLRNTMEELLTTARQLDKRHVQLESRARATIAQSEWAREVFPKQVLSLIHI